MIIIEGIDNSGKSTLAQYIASRLKLHVIESEGPPKFPGELNERLKRYQRHEGPIFNQLHVRHPCISQPIYSAMREEDLGIKPEWMEWFKAQNPVIVYCDPAGRGLSEHVLKEHDSPEHIQKLQDNYGTLLECYRDWAIGNAHIIYRIGDSMPRVHDFIRATR